MQGRAIDIIEIISMSEQGFQQPFLCRAENDYEYYVKGRQTNRASLWCEWICAHLGTAFGLPIPAFKALNVADELIQESPTAFKKLGVGTAFGSQKNGTAAWLEPNMVHQVPTKMQQDVLVFDLWVHNTDRTPGNSNLLWDMEAKALVVIDHNLAFDKDFSPQSFIDRHIFGHQWEKLHTDLVERAHYEARLHTAMVASTPAFYNAPPDWQWENPECDIPARFDPIATLQLLARCSTPELWRTV